MCVGESASVNVHVCEGELSERAVCQQSSSFPEYIDVGIRCHSSDKVVFYKNPARSPQ
jgi:hypothetical protein